MKRLSNQSRAFVRGIFCVSIILLGVSILPIINSKSAINSQFLQASFSLTPHEPISVLCDSDFGSSKYNFPGTGTEEYYYLIDGYNITTTDAIGIYISGTTKYFTIRNCFVDANDKGICIANVDDGTATIINNTISKNEWGITLSSSDSCTITYNLLQENEYHGVFLDSNSDDNIIHHNNFVDNNLGGIFDGTSQAMDHGTTNVWFDTATFQGNYWSNWDGTGSYAIDGMAGAIDSFPQAGFLNPLIISEPSNNTDIQILVFVLVLAIIPLSIVTRKRLKNK